MRNLLLYLMLSIFGLMIGGCTLNSRQEESLNMHISKYLDAQNNCLLVGIVGYTYPPLVKEFKNQGDSILIKNFGCTNNSEESSIYLDPTLKKVKKDNLTIQVLYDFTLSNNDNITKKDQFVVISEDEGKNWYFIPMKYYRNHKICPDLKRAFK